MSKNAGQKLKLMYLSKIFHERTDESHALTILEIIQALDEYGISAERKSLYDDIEALRSFGMDIITRKTDKTRYYLAARDFELAELKLLADAIKSSRFITAKKSEILTQKLGRLTSTYEAKSLKRNMHVLSGGTKSHNESVYYNIDAIHTSILENKKITFRYFSWSLDFGNTARIKRQFRRGGSRYQVSPWTLIWDSQYYYLIAFDDLYGEIRHYRVDKMIDIKLTNMPRDGKSQFEAIDISAYSQKVFSMFAGKDETVKVRFANRLIGVVVDRYGQDVFVSPHDKDSFCATIKVAVSPQFYAWIFSFGDEAEIISPSYVADTLKRQAAEVAELYLKNPN